MSLALAVPASSTVAVGDGRPTVSIAFSMTRGMVEAEDRGLGRPIAIGIVGEHVEVSLEFIDVLEWWRDIVGVPNSFVDYWQQHQYAQVTGEFDGCAWVVKPIIQPCTAEQLCARCTDLGTGTVRVDADGKITPRDHSLQASVAKHRSDLEDLYRQAQESLERTAVL